MSALTGEVRDDRVQVRYAAARRGLLSAQKTAASTPAYLRFVNRRLGRECAAVAAALRLRPAQLTAASAALTLGALLLVVTQSPAPAVAVAVAVLLASGYVLDSADGQLARVRGGGTPAGEWLDHVVDAPKIAAVHLAVLVHLVRFRDLGPDSPYLLVPMLFLLASTTRFFALMLRDQLLRGAGGPGRAAPPRPEAASLGRSLLLLPLDYGVLCWVFLLLPLPRAFLAGYAVLFAAEVLFGVRTLRRTYRLLGAVQP